MDRYNKELVRTNVRQRLYQPISKDEYRVVHLLPGKFVDDIQCVLETRSLRVKTRFEAMSYQWGDELNTQPIQVAYLALRSSRPGTLTKALPQGATRFFIIIFGFLQAATQQFVRYLQILVWLLATYFTCRLLPPFFDPSGWVPSFLPQDIYRILFCMLLSSGYVNFIMKAIKLIIEVAETKPWNLTYNFSVNRSGDDGSLKFETLQVTTNLEIALRHLRWETRARTLWIDALCINQENKKEKTIQIQRMEWIYANASPIVVWLGGYHGLGEIDICAESSSQERADCEHQREIEAAFNYIQPHSRIQLLRRLYFNRDKKVSFQESRSGLCEIARRGWWERLWVIQEIALATGRVQIQCGHNTCDFGEFASAQFSILLEYKEDKAIQDAFSSCENLYDTIKEFRYSSFHDRGGFLATTLSNFMMTASHRAFRDASDDYDSFHELPFAHRLQLILIKTAGRFKCHDDRDRLYAVLGIAGGATTGKASNIASFMENISSYSTRIVLANYSNLLWDHNYNLPIKVGAIIFFAIYSLWGIFYEERAKYWTIHRPEYVVAGHRQVLGAVTGGPREQPNLVEFFTAIANYLAKETNSLAFLDGATCGEDNDMKMPSWVPNWTRELSKPAYDFARRVKKDRALGLFTITDGGKTLQLVGLSKLSVNNMLLIDLNLLQSSPWEGAFEKISVLSTERKNLVASSLTLIGITMYQKSFFMLKETEQRSISSAVNVIKCCLGWGLEILKDAFLAAGGTTMVYNYNVTAPEIGFLRVGKAVKGDRLVVVPGCFHHLVLRSRKRTTEKSNRWKLVGLVAMVTTTTPEGGYSKTEWAQLLENRVLHRYSIE